jgi:hypothetical protein
MALENSYQKKTRAEMRNGNTLLKGVLTTPTGKAEGSAEGHRRLAYVLVPMIVEPHSVARLGAKPSGWRSASRQWSGLRTKQATSEPGRAARFELKPDGCSRRQKRDASPAVVGSGVR